MKIAYISCTSGISGDMFLGAMVDLGLPLPLLEELVRSLGIDGLTVSCENVRRCGFAAKKIHVDVPHEHHHRHLSDILTMIGASSASDCAKSTAETIFHHLAEAEAKVHGTSVDEVHFHEVGAADSIVDILGSAVALDYFKFDDIYSSSVPTGCGTVKIAHGEVAVPAPATAELLKDIPIVPSEIPFELTTPTGAAILKSVVSSFVPMPRMAILESGCGAGSRDFLTLPNILRVYVGKVPVSYAPNYLAAKLPHAAPEPVASNKCCEYRNDVDVNPSLEHCAFSVTCETVCQLETNLDNVTGEQIGYCIERLWDHHPLDVYTTSIMMKKQRPGVKLTVLCREEQLVLFQNLIFSETGTLGIRRCSVQRSILPRKYVQVNTPYGSVDAKMSVLPNGTEQVSLEYESVRHVAITHSVPLRSVVPEILPTKR